MIYLLTGPTRSYKTTTLMHWSRPRHVCGGVLTPDQGDFRVLYNVKEKFSIPWQKSFSDSEDDLQIGRFIFDASAFATAIEWLDDHWMDPSLSYIIVDEIGPLELKGYGWNPWLRKTLNQPTDKHLILVVRESILDEVISGYDLKNYKVVGTTYFDSPMRDL